jgi:hypothetical protein
MKLLALSLFAFAAAITFTGVVLLVRDDGGGIERRAERAATQRRVSSTARSMAARRGIDPLAMEERLRMAQQTCFLLRDVDPSAIVANVCHQNIVNGVSWWATIAPHALREAADLMSKTNE